MEILYMHVCCVTQQQGYYGAQRRSGNWWCCPGWPDASQWSPTPLLLQETGTQTSVAPAQRHLLFTSQPRSTTPQTEAIFLPLHSLTSELDAKYYSLPSFITVKEILLLLEKLVNILYFSQHIYIFNRVCPHNPFSTLKHI